MKIKEYEALKNAITGIGAKVSQIWAFLSEENRFGFSIMNNPAGYIVSTISAVLVGWILGFFSYMVEFILLVAWPFQMVVRTVVDVTIRTGVMIGVPILEFLGDLNTALRETALQFGPLAPVIVLGAYIILGAVAYGVVQLIPIGTIARRARGFI